MRKILLTVRFLGTDFCGYQVQPNGVSVASVLQDAIEGLFGERLPIVGCSRTDAGVHAECFCIHFSTDSSIPCGKILPALNTKLPPTVAVTECREVPENFHARYSSGGKEYKYRILNSRIRDPFLEGRVYRFLPRLDEALLNRAAQDFVGTHDFSSFCAAGGSVEDKVRTVKYAAVEREEDRVTFTVAADGFLYNMVRIMTGTLLDIARGKIAPDSIPEILEAKDRSRAGQTAPAEGLYLTRVFYPEDALKGGMQDG